MIIALDAMGGDNAPLEPVLGALQALEENKEIKILLIGDESVISNILSDKTYDKERLSVYHASEVIENEDSPVRSLRRKKDSSLVRGLELARDKEVDVFVSAGNTGAIVAGGSLIVGRIEGVERPALSAIIPTAKGSSLLLDAGANCNCRPINLVQFAIMGWHYMKSVNEIENPTIKLLNIGAESHKGTEVAKRSYKALKAHVENFCGNIEGRDVVAGESDIIVCDGFSGNIAVKVLEGTAMYVAAEFKRALLSNFVTKLLALSIAKPVKAIKKRMDYAEYGGAPLLGIKGKVIKSHGSSKAKAFKNAILLSAVRYAQSDIIEQLAEIIPNIEYSESEELE